MRSFQSKPLSFFLRFFLFCFIFNNAFIFFSLPNGFSQDNINNKPKANTASRSPVIVDADDVEYLETMITGKGNVKIDYDGVILKSDRADVDMMSKGIVASGNVIIAYKGITLYGEKLEYDIDSKQGFIESLTNNSGKVYALYQDVRIDSTKIDFDLDNQIAQAQGDVVLTQGDSVLTGHTLQYDFKTESGGLVDPIIKSDIWFGKAQKADKKALKNLIELDHAYVTTCDISEKPHYRIQAKRIDYYIDDKIVAKNALMFVGNIPVVYFPYWSQSLKDGRNNPTVSVGYKKEWGAFILTTWRYDLNEYLQYKIHADHRDLKGFASGVDAEYDTKDYGSGTVKTYYMNERDKYWDNEQDKPKETERYRAQIKHRWQADKSTLGLFEYNKLSDIDFTKDYLYKEYAEDFQPVSAGSITHYEDDYSVSIYARKRTNRFYSEVERLPELEFNTVGKEIADSNFYLRNDLALANLNKKIANSGEDTDANRMDSYNELKYPTKLPGNFDWINIAPYVGTRQTYYSKDNIGLKEDFIRGIHYYGFDMNTKFFRIYEYSGKPLGIEVNRLRHVITPSVKYAYIHSPTVPASKLGLFDEIDSISAANFFTFGIENHLQTKWTPSKTGELENVDLVYFYPYLDYYQNAAPGVKHFGFINTELDLRPYRWLHLDSDTVLNQYQRRIQTVNIDLYATGYDKWRLGLGKRYDRNISDQLTTDIYYKINDKWQVRAYTRYLGYTDSFQEQQYTIYRDLHCWLLETSYDIKLNDDGSVADKTFWFIFKLKAFPDETSLQFNVGYETTRRI
ncbi:MAG: LptA/OstA family protein [Candidatus Omnitrophota bacterium]